MKFFRFRCEPVITLLSIWVAGSLPFSAYAQSQPTPAIPIAEHSAEIFDKDPRFDRLITLDKSSISVEALLLSLEQRDLFFTCGRSCADIKLQIRIKNRSVRTLLQAVAELCPVSGTSARISIPFHWV